MAPLVNIGKELQDAYEHPEDEDWSKQFQTKTSYVLKLKSGLYYNISLDSVMHQHQDSVSSVKWSLLESSSPSVQDLCLLSSSFDFSVCFWRYESQMGQTGQEDEKKTGSFSVESTLGALVGNKHAFFGAIFMKDSMSILAYTYGGAIH